jgi:hypothetical protein
MRKVIGLVVLAIWPQLTWITTPTAAGEAEARYVITNGGAEVTDSGHVLFVPAGQRDEPNVASGHSGDTVRLPDGIGCWTRRSANCPTTRSNWAAAPCAQFTHRSQWWWALRTTTAIRISIFPIRQVHHGKTRSTRFSQNNRESDCEKGFCPVGRRIP